MPALQMLKTELGAHWSDTTVLVVTEFGRTVAVNGTRGTDHGTAGCAFLVGGAVAGGRVIADWPGLAARDLHEGRDLRATTDLRALFKAVLHERFGVGEAALAQRVFPRAMRSSRSKGSPLSTRQSRVAAPRGMLARMSRIAFLGLGRMGAGMASRLLAVGHDVTVYNRTPARAEPLVRAGARLANSPRDACADAEAVVAMTADDVSSRAMWLGERRRARGRLGAAGARDRVLDVVARLGRHAGAAARRARARATSTRP